MLNKIQIIGNVGKDPTISTTNNGSRVANFSVAVSERWKTKSGDRQERTEWFPVVVWSEPLIKLIEDFVKKGSKLYIEGKWQTRKWEKDGVERYTTEVVLNNFGSAIELLDGRPTEGGSSSPDRGSAMRDDVGEDFIPFLVRDSIW